ncbi:50S ribosomal protein L3 [candidate division KSB1 bacterium]|nr:50S ribosomal protein L3 [candidate division KSB1 bacterium]
MKLLGKKLYMTSVFDENRVQIPVTVLEVGPCKITQIKTKENDGYKAVQIGYSETREKLLTKPKLGHLKKSGDSLLSKLVEFRTDEVDNFKLGDTLTVDRFFKGELIDITSRSKGRGFTGVVKKFNFRGGPKTHGKSDRLRTPGSVGASSYPSRVIKGKKMPGHYGDRNVTIKNLEVIKVDNENNLLLVKGSVPGSRNSYVLVSKR